ncbi:GT-D fold domain-containing glycosyltransferase [uncultured Clostridium sp.]|jgi:glycosyltransferase family protein|uniref:GT-D fold domain-containing glycosyltransferase n=2 Tax=Bacillati TaxID=1783272 RepID=UPI002618C67B|nr:GT-D fold domain-containing glycosyltransferase [uncultured Clostridium sp.]
MFRLPTLAKLVIVNTGYRIFKVYMRITNKTPKVINGDDTVKYIVTHKCSVARFGDGEFLWIFQERAEGDFEKNSSKLSKKLLQVINSENDNLILCIPDVFKTLRGTKKTARVYWKTFLAKRGYRVLNLLSNSKKYFDTQFTRPYIDYNYNSRNFENKFESLKKIWFNRNVLIVEGEKTRFGVASDLLDGTKSVRRIICPSKNAFERYTQILNNVRSQATLINDALVLVSLGPTATVLAFDLSEMGIQTVDIGHLDVEYNWYKMKAKEKIPVPGKYVNESKAKFIEIDDGLILQKYYKQIIKVIK